MVLFCPQKPGKTTLNISEENIYYKLSNFSVPNVVAREEFVKPMV